MDDSSFNIRVSNLEKIALLQLVQGINSVFFPLLLHTGTWKFKKNVILFAKVSKCISIHFKDAHFKFVKEMCYLRRFTSLKLGNYNHRCSRRYHLNINPCFEAVPRIIVRIRELTFVLEISPVLVLYPEALWERGEWYWFFRSTLLWCCTLQHCGDEGSDIGSWDQPCSGDVPCSTVGMRGVILVRFRSCDGLHFDDLVSTKVQHDYLGAFPRNEEKQIPFGFSFLNQWYQIHCEQQNRSESDIAFNFDNYERMSDVVWILKQESISAGGEMFPLWLHPSWPSWSYQGVGLRGFLDGKGRDGGQSWGQGDIYMPCDWPMASWVMVTWGHLLVNKMTERQTRLKTLPSNEVVGGR